MLMLVDNFYCHFLSKIRCFAKFQDEKELSKKQFFYDYRRFNDQLYGGNKNSGRIVLAV